MKNDSSVVWSFIKASVTLLGIGIFFVALIFIGALLLLELDANNYVLFSFICITTLIASFVAFSESCYLLPAKSSKNFTLPSGLLVCAFTFCLTITSANTLYNFPVSCYAGCGFAIFIGWFLVLIQEFRSS